MKKLLLFTLIFYTSICHGQTDYYFQNNGKSVQTKEDVKVTFKQHSLLASQREGMNFKPIIYHRETRNDSIINYYYFESQPGDTSKLTDFEFIYRQDSLFLFLGKRLPEFELMDVNGNVFTSSQLIGKPTLLNFTTIYCKPCLEEIPRLNKLKTKYGNKLNFIAIIDVPRKESDLKNFLDNHPFQFHVLNNTAEYKDILKDGFLNYNVFLDKEGVVRYIQFGFTYGDGNSESNYFVKIIEEIIQKQ